MTQKKTKSSNIRINKVYTRTGDMGKTRLIGGVQCYKDDKRIEAYGTVDELNSHIGICREMLKNENINSFDFLINYLQLVQNELFNLGTQLGASGSSKSVDLPQLTKDAVEDLEKEIDKINIDLPELTSFVLPGGNQINTQFHVTRNVCRRAERRVVTLFKDQKLDIVNIKYLNRLSDALFVWSRWISLVLNDEEHLWMPNS